MVAFPAGTKWAPRMHAKQVPSSEQTEQYFAHAYALEPGQKKQHHAVLDCRLMLLRWTSGFPQQQVESWNWTRAENLGMKLELDDDRRHYSRLVLSPSWRRLRRREARRLSNASRDLQPHEASGLRPQGGGGSIFRIAVSSQSHSESDFLLKEVSGPYTKSTRCLGCRMAHQPLVALSRYTSNLYLATGLEAAGICADRSISICATMSPGPRKS